MNRTVLALFAATALVACQQKEEQPAPPAPVATAAPAPLPAPAAPAAATVAAAVAAAVPAAGDLPTPEDFEKQALDEINPQNLEQELDKLEKEIGQ